jgi:hypothetical protein
VPDDQLTADLAAVHAALADAAAWKRIDTTSSPPVCARCDEPILGAPRTDPGDPLKRQYCTEGCSDADDETRYEQQCQPGVAT